MKRIVPFIIFLILILSFNSFVFAVATPEGKQQNQEAKAELSLLKGEFQENKTEIENLRSEIVSLLLEVKNQLGVRQTSSDDISTKDLDHIKGYLKTIKEDRKALREINNGEMKSLLQNYKEAMESRELSAAKTYLESVLEIQDKKIGALQKIADDTGALLEIL